MYKVTTYHNQPFYRNGDLEEQLVMIKCDVYKTKKEAKAYIESKLTTKSYRDYRTGKNLSICTHFTNKSWIHENTGDECYEYFKYELIKT